jgi:RNA polymerase sigma factor (sigma-70 family)
MKEVSRELIKQCSKGDRRSQTELYSVVYPMMMGMCRRYVVNQDDAVTIVNNGYLKLINSLKTYSFDGAFEAWCRKIMTNTIIDEYRKNKTRSETLQLREDVTSMSRLHILNETEEKYTAEQLEIMLLALPEATRLVFNLYAIEGYSHSEIAEMLGISDGTSKWHVSKAREELKKMIASKQKIASA